MELSQVNVDLWGPETICNKNAKDYNIYVMAMVYPVIGWLKLSQLKSKPYLFVCMMRFDSALLAHYPRLREIGFNNGSEFIAEFSELCNNMSLKQCPLSSWNPQSNVILERIHQV